MQDQVEAKGEDEAQQDEENCPDPMETLGELEFVYEELELRVEIHRARHQARMAATPTLRKPPRRPFDATFYSSAANQSYTLDILYEFYANLANMIKRDGTTWVFVRKHMYEFSPGIINSIFKTPCQEADFPRMPWTTENLDDAMPTANRSTLTIDRLKFIHMLTEGRPFDFGVMVFDQIYDLGQQAISGKENKLLFPNLIQHVLETQHPIPVCGVDADPVAPVNMVFDLKQGLPKKPSGTGSAQYSLNKDMGRYHRLLDTIVGRAARGVYGDLSTLGDSSSNDEVGEAGAEDHDSLSDEF
ncbi:hypothetical protein Bca101_005877 [Brassica carinata]